MMRYALVTVLALLFLCTYAAPPALAAEPERASEIVVDYQGRLQDANGDPISGVFNLEFKLYDGEHAAHSVWSARQFVAVVDGDYTVPLGLKNPLQRSALPSDAWIGVEWIGQGELLRDHFKIAGKLEDSADSKSSAGGNQANLQWKISPETRALLEAAKKGDRVAFADIAERAVSADKADTALRAETIGDMNAEDIKETSTLALDRLGEHLADPNAHEATGGIRLGDNHSVQKRAGGRGGSPYKVMCPPGQVVTGIEGAAGRLLDSIRIVCTKLK